MTTNELKQAIQSNGARVKISQTTEGKVRYIMAVYIVEYIEKGKVIDETRTLYFDNALKEMEKIAELEEWEGI